MTYQDLISTLSVLLLVSIKTLSVSMNILICAMSVLYQDALSVLYQDALIVNQLCSYTPYKYLYNPPTMYKYPNTTPITTLWITINLLIRSLTASLTASLISPNC